MTSQLSEKQTVEFAVDKNIIYSIIKSQAGSPSKAFLELVMNSIDAKATEVIINFTKKRFTVIDNGRGFQSLEEIESYFRTFGTPHEEGDATYGRFRMGRGQIMAFSKNTWRTNTFKMEVDILNKGIDFDLYQNLDFVEGVQITGEFYEELTSLEYNNIISELKKYLKYSQIKTIVNGAQVNNNKEEEKWTIKNEDAYIRVRENTSVGNTLSIYNLGVLVCDYPASKFGFSGVIISQKQLEVNFARNDILIKQCKVWKNIVKTLDKHFYEKLNKKIKQKINFSDTEIAKMSNMFKNNQIEKEDIKKFPIFIDVLGKKFNLQKILNAKVITIAEYNSTIEEKIYRNEYAFVLNKDTLINFDIETVEEFKEMLKTITFKNEYYSEYSKINKIRFVEIKELRESINDNYITVPDTKLSPKQLATLKAIRQQQHLLIDLINRSHTTLEYKVEKREIVIDESEVVEAWTDGNFRIWINKNLLQQVDLGIGGWIYIANLIIHEYLHNDNNNIHDIDFYENFHNVITAESFTRAFGKKQDTAIVRFAKKANSIYVKYLTKNGNQISNKVSDLHSITHQGD